MKRVFAFIGFSLAITLILLNTIAFDYSVIVLIIAGIIFVLSLLFSKIRQAIAVPVCFGTAVFACLIFMFVNSNTVIPVQSLDREYVTAKIQLIDIPQKTDDGYAYKAEALAVDKSGAPQNFKLRLKSESLIDADYYDDITADLTLYKIADSPFQSYGYYGDGIYVSGVINSYSVQENEHKPLNYYLILFRERLINTLLQNLSYESAGLAAAIITGDKSNLTYEIINSFNVCGIAHLIAVSGFHTSIVCLGFYYFLKKLRVPEIPITFVSILILIIYIGIADFAKSAIRAGIMLSVVMIARLINNKADSLNSLGFAVFIICLNPFAVADAGAVLSVCAVLGIIVIKPAFDRYLFPKKKAVRFIYNSVFVTASVIISTLPAMWLFFGSTSIVGIVLNILMIPLAQAVLISALLFSVFSAVYVIAFPFEKICSMAAFLMIKISSFFAENFSQFDLNLNDEIFGIAVAVSFLFIGISLLLVKRIKLKITVCFITVLFFLSSMISVYNYNSYAYIKVISDGCIVIYDKHCTAVINADTKNDYYELKSIAENKNMPLYIINCEDMREKIAEFSDINADLNTNLDFNIDLCACINVKCIGERITACVFDREVIIDERKVSVGSYSVFRDIKHKFSDDTDYTICFKENMQTFVRRDSKWRR